MSTVKYPLATEKSIRLMESENKLIFIVEERANKIAIKEDIQKLFGAKVDRVYTLTDRKGRKRAYVKFNAETPAIDIATKLGLM